MKNYQKPEVTIDNLYATLNLMAASGDTEGLGQIGESPGGGIPGGGGTSFGAPARPRPF